MKTLIIHPADPSTNFLRTIYRNIKNKTVVTGNMTKPRLRALIVSHDRVMMMGHGGGMGLLNVHGFLNESKKPIGFKIINKKSYPRYAYTPYIIDESMVDLLAEKKNSVFIWCHAATFVEKHQLRGFYSGMFISEVSEANLCGVIGTQQWEVDQSNYVFCKILSEFIHRRPFIAYKKVLKRYGWLALRNRVAQYNHERLGLIL